MGLSKALWKRLLLVLSMQPLISPGLCVAATSPGSQFVLKIAEDLANQTIYTECWTNGTGNNEEASEVQVLIGLSDTTLRCSSSFPVLGPEALCYLLNSFGSATVMDGAILAKILLNGPQSLTAEEWDNLPVKVIAALIKDISKFPSSTLKSIISSLTRHGPRAVPFLEETFHYVKNYSITIVDVKNLTTRCLPGCPSLEYSKILENRALQSELGLLLQAMRMINMESSELVFRSAFPSLAQSKENTQQWFKLWLKNKTNPEKLDTVFGPAILRQFYGKKLQLLKSADELAKLLKDMGPLAEFIPLHSLAGLGELASLNQSFINVAVRTCRLYPSSGLCQFLFYKTVLEGEGKLKHRAVVPETLLHVGVGYIPGFLNGTQNLTEILETLSGTQHLPSSLLIALRSAIIDYWNNDDLSEFPVTFLPGLDNKDFGSLLDEDIEERIFDIQNIWPRLNNAQKFKIVQKFSQNRTVVPHFVLPRLPGRGFHKHINSLLKGSCNSSIPDNLMRAAVGRNLKSMLNGTEASCNDYAPAVTCRGILGLNATEFWGFLAKGFPIRNITRKCVLFKSKQLVLGDGYASDLQLLLELNSNEYSLIGQSLFAVPMEVVRSFLRITEQSDSCKDFFAAIDSSELLELPHVRVTEYAELVSSCLGLHNKTVINAKSISSVRRIAAFFPAKLIAVFSADAVAFVFGNRHFVHPSICRSSEEKAIIRNAIIEKFNHPSTWTEAQIYHLGCLVEVLNEGDFESIRSGIKENVVDSWVSCIKSAENLKPRNVECKHGHTQDDYTDYTTDEQEGPTEFAPALRSAIRSFLRTIAEGEAKIKGFAVQYETIMAVELQRGLPSLYDRLEIAKIPYRELITALQQLSTMKLSVGEAGALWGVIRCKWGLASEVPSDVLLQLGTASLGIPLEHMSQLNLNNTDVIAAMSATKGYSMDQLKALAKAILRKYKRKLPMDLFHVEALGPILCGFPEKYLKTHLKPEVLGRASAAFFKSLTICSEPELKLVARPLTANRGYGNPASWSSGDVAVLDSVVSGLEPEQLEKLPLQSLERLSPDVAARLNSKQVSAITPAVPFLECETVEVLMQKFPDLNIQQPTECQFEKSLLVKNLTTSSKFAVIFEAPAASFGVTVAVESDPDLRLEDVFQSDTPLSAEMVLAVASNLPSAVYPTDMLLQLPEASLFSQLTNNLTGLTEDQAMALVNSGKIHHLPMLLKLWEEVLPQWNLTSLVLDNAIVKADKGLVPLAAKRKFLLSRPKNVSADWFFDVLSTHRRLIEDVDSSTIANFNYSLGKMLSPQRRSNLVLVAPRLFKRLKILEGRIEEFIAPDFGNVPANLLSFLDVEELLGRNPSLENINPSNARWLINRLQPDNQWTNVTSFERYWPRYSLVEEFLRPEDFYKVPQSILNSSQFLSALVNSSEKLSPAFYSFAKYLSSENGAVALQALREAAEKRIKELSTELGTLTEPVESFESWESNLNGKNLSVFLTRNCKAIGRMSWPKLAKLMENGLSFSGSKAHCAARKFKEKLAARHNLEWPAADEVLLNHMTVYEALEARELLLEFSAESYARLAKSVRCRDLFNILGQLDVSGKTENFIMKLAASGLRCLQNNSTETSLEEDLAYLGSLAPFIPSSQLEFLNSEALAAVITSSGDPAFPKCADRERRNSLRGALLNLKPVEQWGVEDLDYFGCFLTVLNVNDLSALKLREKAELSRILPRCLELIVSTSKSCSGLNEGDISEWTTATSGSLQMAVRAALGVSFSEDPLEFNEIDQPLTCREILAYGGFAYVPLHRLRKLNYDEFLVCLPSFEERYVPRKAAEVIWKTVILPEFHSPSNIPPSLLRVQREFLKGASPDELFHLNISSWETVAALGAVEGFSILQLQSLSDNVISSLGPGFFQSALHLNAMGVLLCGQLRTDLEHVEPSLWRQVDVAVYKKLQSCPTETFTDLVGVLRQDSAFGDPETWTDVHLATLGFLINGLEKDKIAAIPAEAMQGLSIDAIELFSAGVLSAFTEEQISGLQFSEAEVFRKRLECTSCLYQSQSPVSVFEKWYENLENLYPEPQPAASTTNLDTRPLTSTTLMDHSTASPSEITNKHLQTSTLSSGKVLGSWMGAPASDQEATSSKSPEEMMDDPNTFHRKITIKNVRKNTASTASTRLPVSPSLDTGKEIEAQPNGLPVISTASPADLSTPPRAKPHKMSADILAEFAFGSTITTAGVLVEVKAIETETTSFSSARGKDSTLSISDISTSFLAASETPTEKRDDTEASIISILPSVFIERTPASSSESSVVSGEIKRENAAAVELLADESLATGTKAETASVSLRTDVAAEVLEASLTISTTKQPGLANFPPRKIVTSSETGELVSTTHEPVIVSEQNFSQHETSETSTIDPGAALVSSVTQVTGLPAEGGPSLFSLSLGDGFSETPFELAPERQKTTFGADIHNASYVPEAAEPYTGIMSTDVPAKITVSETGTPNSAKLAEAVDLKAVGTTDMAHETDQVFVTSAASEEETVSEHLTEAISQVPAVTAVTKVEDSVTQASSSQITEEIVETTIGEIPEATTSVTQGSTDEVETTQTFTVSPVTREVSTEIRVQTAAIDIAASVTPTREEETSSTTLVATREPEIETNAALTSEVTVPATLVPVEETSRVTSSIPPTTSGAEIETDTAFMIELTVPVTQVTDVEPSETPGTEADADTDLISTTTEYTKDDLITTPQMDSFMQTTQQAEISTETNTTNTFGVFTPEEEHDYSTTSVPSTAGDESLTTAEQTGTVIPPVVIPAKSCGDVGSVIVTVQVRDPITKEILVLQGLDPIISYQGQTCQCTCPFLVSEETTNCKK